MKSKSKSQPDWLQNPGTTFTSSKAVLCDSVDMNSKWYVPALRSKYPSFHTSGLESGPTTYAVLLMGIPDMLYSHVRTIMLSLE